MAKQVKEYELNSKVKKEVDDADYYLTKGNILYFVKKYKMYS